MRRFAWQGLVIVALVSLAVFLPLLAWAFWIGIAPQPYFKVLERPVAQIVERVHPGYYADHHLSNPLTTSSASLRCCNAAW